MRRAAIAKKPRPVETLRAALLTSLALGTGGAYLFGLVYLVARGAAKVFSFTLYATPLDDVDGETAMRMFVVAALAGGALWLLVRLVELACAPRRFPHALRTAGIALATLAAALFAQNHAPRFLISLPREMSAGGGIGPELFNTLYFAALSTIFTLPVGLGAALYMARFARGRRLVASVRIALDTLAALPSIVYGLFGFLVFVVALHLNYSRLAGAFVLALLNLPLVVGICEESLRSVPRDLEDASLSLGATHVQTAFRVTLPYAWPGILSAMVLSLGRVFAESAPLIMTAGTTISRTYPYSLNPLRGGETLAVHLWYVNSTGLSPDRADVSAGTAAALVVLIASTNFLAARLARYGGATGTRLKKAVRTA